MKNFLIKEWEGALDAFFENASDDEFWAALDEADKGIYSKIDVPILGLQCGATQHVWTSRYSVAAKPIIAPSGVMRDLRYNEVALKGATSNFECRIAV